jgi:hypothetical protein
MVRHHVLIGLGFKRQNFRNRALKYMVDKKIIGSDMTMRPTVMPPSYNRPQIGRGPLPVHRAPLKFNY